MVANPVSGNLSQRFHATFQEASRSTGANFDFLLKTAARESAFNPTAKAPTSSATGLFQFVEQTWLETMKQAGPSLGYSDEAAQITQVGDKYYVRDSDVKQQILDMRKDPKASALLAGAYSKKNESLLTERLNRTPSSGELYAAHFLGAQGSGRLIELAESNPSLDANKVFPQQAQANRNIFFDKQGNAKSVGEVYENLVGTVPEKTETKSVLSRVFNLGEWFKPKESMQASRFDTTDKTTTKPKLTQEQMAQAVAQSNASLSEFFNEPAKQTQTVIPSRFSMSYSAASPLAEGGATSRIATGQDNSQSLGAIKAGGSQSRIYTDAAQVDSQSASDTNEMRLPRRKPVTADVYVDSLNGVLPKSKPVDSGVGPTVLDPQGTGNRARHGAMDLTAFLDGDAFNAGSKA